MNVDLQAQTKAARLSQARSPPRVTFVFPLGLFCSLELILLRASEQEREREKQAQSRA